MAVRHRDGNQYNEKKNEKATCDMVMMMMFELELPYRLRQHGSKAFRNLSPAGWMNRALKRAERRRSLAHVCRALNEVTLSLVAHDDDAGAETLPKSRCGFTLRRRRRVGAVDVLHFADGIARLRPRARARAWP